MGSRRLERPEPQEGLRLELQQVQAGSQGFGVLGFWVLGLRVLGF